MLCYYYYYYYIIIIIIICSSSSSSSSIKLKLAIHDLFLLFSLSVCVISEGTNNIL